MVLHPPDPAPVESPSAGVVAARRALPGSRALLGGLLVAAAGVGLFTAAGPDPKQPSTSYVVARRTVHPGALVRADDLTVEPLELSRAVADAALTDVRSAVGRVSLGPLEPGQLVGEASLAPAGRPTSPVLAFSLPPERAAGGDVLVGDRVDLVVTWGHEADSPTEVVARDLEVVAVRRPRRDALGAADSVTLTVAVPDGVEAYLPLVRALRAGDVTVVRTTGTRPAGAGS